MDAIVLLPGSCEDAVSPCCLVCVLFCFNFLQGTCPSGEKPAVGIKASSVWPLAEKGVGVPLCMKGGALVKSSRCEDVSLFPLWVVLDGGRFEASF